MQHTTTEGNGMVTTDEIRQRVEQADRQRLESRAAAATATAAAIEQRTLARDGLATAQRAAATQIAAATTVMTVDELATFTGIPVTELQVTARTNGHVRKPTRARTPRKHAPTPPEQAALDRVVEAVQQVDEPPNDEQHTEGN